MGVKARRMLMQGAQKERKEIGVIAVRREQCSPILALNPEQRSHSGKRKYGDCGVSSIFNFAGFRLTKEAHPWLYL